MTLLSPKLVRQFTHLNCVFIGMAYIHLCSLFYALAGGSSQVQEASAQEFKGASDSPAV